MQLQNKEGNNFQVAEKNEKRREPWVRRFNRVRNCRCMSARSLGKIFEFIRGFASAIDHQLPNFTKINDFLKRESK